MVELHGAAEAAALRGQGVRPAHRNNRRVVNLNNNRVGSQSWNLDGEHRGGAANFGFISIAYHQYIFGLYKYILRLEISIFDRENNKNRQELRIIICFRDIQSGRGTTINVGY